MPASFAIAGKCKAALVDPPVAATTTAAFFKDSIVVLSSITSPQVAKQYNGNSTYIIQSQSQCYKDLGWLFAVSVSEVAYAFSILYGGKDIYLLGLDYALDPLTNESHDKNHINASIHEEVDEDYTKESLDVDTNYIMIKGNLRETVYTTSRLYLSVPNFNNFTQVLKSDDVSVYNLNDGAYLENIQPLIITDIDVSKFKCLEKTEISIDLNNDFLNNAKNDLTVYDKKILKRKLKNAKYINKKLASYLPKWQQKANKKQQEATINKEDFLK